MIGAFVWLLVLAAMPVMLEVIGMVAVAAVVAAVVVVMFVVVMV